MHIDSIKRTQLHSLTVTQDHTANTNRWRTCEKHTPPVQQNMYVDACILRNF